MPNLSLLSRGIGQAVKKDHGKLEVHYEPEDYLNWKSHESYSRVSKTSNAKHTMKDCLGLCLPKTYSTRRGALVLYSEDLAEPLRKKRHRRTGQQSHRHKRKLQMELHTLRDLTRAILAYGGKQKEHKGSPWHPYLHFLNQPDNQIDRQIRPGYSAKRYLSRLSQTWDPSITARLQCAGCIKDPLLFQEYTQIHGKIQQDLSAVPEKYHFLPVLPSFWDELSQKIHIGQSYLFLKEPENREKLAESYGSQETPGRKRARLLVRASVREQRPGAAQDTTWSHSTCCPGVPQSIQPKGLQVATSATANHSQRNKQNHTENPGDNEKLKKATEGFVRNTTINISHLLSEKSHSTFYGGYFPERKKYYNAKQGHMKSQDVEVKRLNENSFFPPIPSAMGSEQDAAREEQIKIPETLKLPTISEESPRAYTLPKKHLKSSKTPKELLVIPLLVQMQTGLKTRTQKGTLCYTSKPETNGHENLLAPSLDDLISGREGTAKQHQMVTGGHPDIHQGSFIRAPTGNQEFTLERRKAEVRGINAGKEGHYKKDGELCTQNVVPALGVLPPIDGKKNPGHEDNRAGAKAPSSSHVLPDSTSKALPAGLAHGALPEEGKECFNSASLGSIIMVPDGGILCQPLLGSVQNTDAPIQLSFNPGQGDSEIPFETRACLHRYSHEASLTQEMSNKEVPGMQARQSFQSNKKMESRMRQESRSCSENKLVKRNSSPVSEFSEQQSQDDPSGSFRLMQDIQTKMDSGSLLHSYATPWIPEAEQRGGADSVKDPEKQTDRNPECSISQLEACFDLSACPIKDIQDIESESGSSLLRSSSHQEMEKEKSGVKTSNSEKQFMREKEETFQPTESGKAAAGKSFGIDTGVAEIKATKSISHKLTKMDQTSKKQKISNKNKQYRKTEFVIGKPKEKRTTGKKRAQAESERAAARRQEALPEPTAERGAQGPCTDPASPAAGSGEAASSCPASPSPPEEEDEALPDDHQAHRGDGGIPPALSHSPPTLAGSTHTAAGRSSGASEVPPRKWQEDKLAQEKRAEKAEKRRLEVERKRKEREEQKWKKQEQQEQMEKMKAELEKEQHRRTEDMRLQKQRLEKEWRRQEEEEAARKSQLEKAAQERIWQQQEEYRRKLQQFQKKRQLEEQEQEEAEKQRQREMWLEEQHQQLVEMVEEQGLEYDRRNQEEEKARHEAEEQRKKAEEEARLALEEDKRQAQLLIRQKAALEQHLQFQRALLIETTGLEHTQDISRPWVFSYFQLLEKLGPEKSTKE